MKSAILAKRGWIFILVLATIAVFIGIVWLITAYTPWQLPGGSSPSHTPQAVVQRNCTYPLSYWIEHPERYPAQIVVGEKIYQREEISGILSLRNQSLVGRLEAQLVGAFLNTQAGADQNQVNDSLYQAYQWVVNHPDDNLLTPSELEAGNQLISALQAFNQGQAGVVACLGVATVPTAASGSPPGSLTPTTGTPTPTRTPTPSMTITPTPTATYPTITYPTLSLTFTLTSTAPGGWYPTETRAPAPTFTPTEEEAPSITPTQTKEPSLTQTSVPPTETATNPPPPPATPTETPAPTLPIPTPAL